MRWLVNVKYFWRLKHGKGILLLIFVVVATLSWPIKADELDDLKEQLSELHNKITQLEARQRQKERSMTAKIEEMEKKTGDLERDAVVGAYSDSDFTGGLAGGKGHRIGMNYQLAKNVQYGMIYFHNEVTLEDPDLDYRRLQADLKLKF